MTAVYREFPIRGAQAWTALTAFVKANWKAVLDRGGVLRIIVTEDEKARTIQQNRFFHGPVLDAITQQAWVNGQQFSKQAWKEHFRLKYLLSGEMVLPSGEIVNTYHSTADLNVTEFTEFLENVQAEAATEWGVIFTDPARYGYEPVKAAA